jgi:hypothetical protein
MEKSGTRTGHPNLQKAWTTGQLYYANVVLLLPVAWHLGQLVHPVAMMVSLRITLTYARTGQELSAFCKFSSPLELLKSGFLSDGTVWSSKLAEGLDNWTTVLLPHLLLVQH